MICVFEAEYRESLTAAILLFFLNTALSGRAGQKYFGKWSLQVEIRVVVGLNISLTDRQRIR